MGGSFVTGGGLYQSQYGILKELRFVEEVRKDKVRRDASHIQGSQGL